MHIIAGSVSSSEHFDRWVAENNPASHLSYGKGWWDYIELVRRLTHKFELERVEVISTYLMQTPPPYEELLMPVVSLWRRGLRVILAWDFGPLYGGWCVNMDRGRPIDLPATFLPAMRPEPGWGRLQTKLPAWLYSPYQPNCNKFSCALDDELDLACLLRLLITE
jgi:hypothetical protein